MSHVSKRIAVIVIGLTVCLGTSSAQASGGSMRCGTNLVYAGGGPDSSLMYEVLKKCGQPEAKLGNSWVYVQGSMERILMFNSAGRLHKIESNRN